MITLPQSSEIRLVRSSDDVVAARQLVRTWAVAMGFGLVEQTKIVTAVSELARNALDHGGGGVMRLEAVQNGHRHGVRVTLEDTGPGIADVDLALKDGYTTGGGLGLGLGGARRLASEFEIVSRPGEGTRVSFVRWR